MRRITALRACGINPNQAGLVSIKLYSASARWPSGMKLANKQFLHSAPTAHGALGDIVVRLDAPIQVPLQAVQGTALPDAFALQRSWPQFLLARSSPAPSYRTSNSIFQPLLTFLCVLAIKSTTFKIRDTSWFSRSTMQSSKRRN
jgi:hypothetical protein